VPKGKPTICKCLCLLAILWHVINNDFGLEFNYFNLIIPRSLGENCRKENGYQKARLADFLKVVWSG
jgi:hypothetical protein